MTRRILLTLLTLLGAAALSVAQAKDDRPPVRHRDALTPQQQKAFLARRNTGDMAKGLMLKGTFDSVCSYLYAWQLNLHSDTGEGSFQSQLTQVFPAFYRPTWRELFETYARQTGCRWGYDPRRNGWIFDPPALPRPYTFDLPAGWKQRDWGMCLTATPPNAPVAVEIWLFGTYSFDEKDPEQLAALRDQVRRDHALRFARFDLSAVEMRKTTVAGAEALYTEVTPSDDPDVRYRQWAFLADGDAILITSTIRTEHEARVLPGVQTIVKSLRHVPVDTQPAAGRMRRTAEGRKALAPEQRVALLARRTTGSMLEGTFDNVASCYDAAAGVCIHTDDEDVRWRRLSAVFPEFYRPTWRELLDTVARQTGTRFTYDPKRDFWVFAPPAPSLPYSFDLAKGWIKEDRGEYLFTKPPVAPIGMDIWLKGTYSFDEADPKERAAARDRVRHALAVRFARSFKKDVTEADMKKVTVGGAKALFFTAVPPRHTDTRWRQWAFLAGSHGIVIVSILHDKNETRLLPDVEAMVKSFRLLPQDPADGR